MKKKIRYRNLKKLDKETKKILITILTCFIIIIIMNGLINYLEKKESQKNSNSQYSSIEEILNKYGCTYIDEKESKDSNFSIEIYLKFKYKTFEQEQSNKRYYENIISDLIAFIQKDFKLVDEENNILIEIKNEGMSYIYTINGKEDYFDKEQAKLNLDNIETDKTSKFIVNSLELQELITNNWKKDVINFGTKDSTFNNYDIYFDEGIEIRNINKQAFNIVFTQKYTKQVINEIIPGATFEDIVSKLGTPTYGTEKGEYIGYKNNQMYVFFTKEKIYIYKNEKSEMKEFEELLIKYINNSINIKKFMNELTYLWPDYEEYKYSSNSVYINYPQRGIKIEMNTDNPLGICIYKNCRITEKIKELINTRKISENLKDDLIDITMEKEILKQDEKIYIASLIENEEENSSNTYYLYYDFDENNLMTDISFISKTNDVPSRDLSDKINQGIFLNDNLFIYSIENKGIYLLNVKTNEKTTIKTGKQQFNIVECKDNILKFDNEEIKLNME